MRFIHLPELVINASLPIFGVVGRPEFEQQRAERVLDVLDNGCAAANMIDIMIVYDQYELAETIDLYRRLEAHRSALAAAVPFLTTIDDMLAHHLRHQEHIVYGVLEHLIRLGIEQYIVYLEVGFTLRNPFSRPGEEGYFPLTPPAPTSTPSISPSQLSLSSSTRSTAASSPPPLISSPSSSDEDSPISSPAPPAFQYYLNDEEEIARFRPEPSFSLMCQNPFCNASKWNRNPYAITRITAIDDNCPYDDPEEYLVTFDVCETCASSHTNSIASFRIDKSAVGCGKVPIPDTAKREDELGDQYQGKPWGYVDESAWFSDPVVVDKLSVSVSPLPRLTPLSPIVPLPINAA